MKRWIAFIIVSVIVLSITGCNSAGKVEQAAEETVKIKVYTKKPQLQDIVKKNSFSGKVIPENSVKVYSNQSERVVKTYAEVGDYVNAGDLLFEVRTLHTENKVESAKAELESTKSEAAKMKGSTTDNAIDGANQGRDNLDNALKQMEKGLDSLEESVSQARKGVKSAKVVVNKILESNGGNPPADGTPEDVEYKQAQRALDSAETQYDSLKSQLDDMDETYEDQREKLESQLEISEEMSTIAEKEIKEDLGNLADAMVEMQEKNYKNALKELEDSKVYAPISGTVRTKNVVDNNMVSESTIAYEIFSKNNVSVEFGVSEKSISKLSIGDKVEVTYSGTRLVGKITEIPMMADSQTGLFNVKADVDNTNSKLLTGSVVKVMVPVEKSMEVLTVPISCVYFEGNEHYIYVNDEGTAKKVSIETGVSNNKFMEVTSGLTEDDEVVTTWHPNLLPGCKLEVIENDEPTQQETTVVNEEGNDQEDESK